MVTTSSASNNGSRGGSMTTQTGPPEPPEHGTVGMDGMGLPAIARYWWLTALRGLVALALGVAVAVSGPRHRPPGHLPRPVLADRRAHHPAVRPGHPPTSWVPAGTGSGHRGGRGGGAGTASRPALRARGPRRVRRAAGHRRGAHRRAADPRRVRCRGAGWPPLDARRDRARHVGARARCSAAADQRRWTRGCWCRSWPPGGRSAASCCWPRGCGCAASHAPGGRHRARRPRIVS